ncbi:MAG: hypothetical protein M1819_002380 [Sarea resinae]|nr:MAG: hypothetical protein M1819_002380 [Sarea resinae]
MRFLSWTALWLASTLLTQSLSLPQTGLSLARRDGERDAILIDAPDFGELQKRRGGGGGGRGGSGELTSATQQVTDLAITSSGKSGSSAPKSSSPKSSSPKSSNPKSGSSSSKSYSTKSDSGGKTVHGSGVRPSYGGGHYYAGGAAVPYTSGRRSPLGLAPFLIPIAGLAYFAGPWHYPVYAYHYSHPSTYHNASAAPAHTTATNITNANSTMPVLCLCQQYCECGCDDNANSTYIESIIGNGNPSQFNQSLVRLSVVNGTETLIVNGTLANGTTAAGGTASSAGVKGAVLRYAGFVAVAVTVICMVWA